MSGTVALLTYTTNNLILNCALFAGRLESGGVGLDFLPRAPPGIVSVDLGVKRPPKDPLPTHQNMS